VGGALVGEPWPVLLAIDRRAGKRIKNIEIPQREGDLREKEETTKRRKEEKGKMQGRGQLGPRRFVRMRFLQTGAWKGK